jgi:hypothetical protein
MREKQNEYCAVYTPFKTISMASHPRKQQTGNILKMIFRVVSVATNAGSYL